jgi:energy-coupling factor transporter ATP-binding protein EcfA2
MKGSELDVLGWSGYGHTVSASLWAVIGLVVGIAGAVIAGVVAFRLGVRRSGDGLRPVKPDSDLSLTSLSIGSEQDEPTQSIPPIPADLVEACAAGQCLVFLGSGVGAQVGLPTWQELLDRIIRQTASVDSQAGWANASQSLRDRPSLLAELIRENVSSADLMSTLRNIFDRPVRELPRLCELLGGIPFSGVLSSCWDRIPEVTFDRLGPAILTFRDEEELTRRFRENRFTILRLYGDLQRPETFLFTQTDLSRALYENPACTRTILSMFLTKTVLFVGVSQDGIENFFEAFSHFQPGSHTHFALVPRHPDTKAREQFLLSRYGVQVLPYVPSSGHPELEAFVSGLKSEIAASVSSSLRPAVTRATLNEVRLKNIGPFEDLALSFEPGWTVLLGNNGSGKSTLLRAIGLGVCGDDGRAMEAGARLLRNDANTGVIEVRIGTDRYRTELIRDQKHVIVRSRQITPLQAGTWVILGFPPLRGVSVHKSKGPSDESFSSPTVGDLLPLLVSSIDSRIDDIKQWIVNLELGKRETRRSQQLLRSFFHIVQAMTPGLTFEYVGLGDNYDVMVRTDDGVISIDLISQGTSSIVNWVGTLLQRMYEIYTEAEAPEREPAVVLIDEVDAHMHPEWQRVLMGLMQKHFPNLQVIATTHSPLMVGNLEPRHVVAMRRFKERVEAEITDDGLASPGPQGMGVAGVLIEMFGLPSTLDTITQGKIDRRNNLSRVDNRSAAQEAEFQGLTSELESLGLVYESRDRNYRNYLKALKAWEDSHHRQVNQLPANEQEEIIRGILDDLISEERS